MWIGGGAVACVVLLFLLRWLLAPTVIVVDHREGRNGPQGAGNIEAASPENTQEKAGLKKGEPPRQKIQRVEVPPRPGAPGPTTSAATEETEDSPAVEKRLRPSVYLVQLEKFNELLPFVTCCAIAEKTLITTGREAAQLVKWRKSGTFHRIWVSNETGSVRREVEEIRADRRFVKLAKEGDRQAWIYVDFALLTVAEELPAFVPLASADDLKGLDSGLPLVCLGFSHDGKKITRHNPPKLQAGSNTRIYTITTIPVAAELPAAGEPPRLLHLEGNIPHQSIEVPQSGGKVLLPAYGSPIFNQQGRLVAVYGDTMAPGKGQELLGFHYAPVINPALIDLWLQKEDTQTWALPDILPASAGPAGK
jgi:hypothetical protein